MKGSHDRLAVGHQGGARRRHVRPCSMDISRGRSNSPAGSLEVRRSLEVCRVRWPGRTQNGIQSQVELEISPRSSPMLGRRWPQQNRVALHQRILVGLLARFEACRRPLTVPSQTVLPRQTGGRDGASDMRGVQRGNRLYRRWPDLTHVEVRVRSNLAYVDGSLSDGAPIEPPLPWRQAPRLGLRGFQDQSRRPRRLPPAQWLQ